MLYHISKDAQNNVSSMKAKKTELAKIGWLEEDLEILLKNNMQEFIYSGDLMPIFSERKFQEEPDIMAIDSKGDLYFFELKRWKSNKENLLQVLRYGQIYGKSSYSDLNDLYKKEKGNDVDLYEQFKSYFDIIEGEDSPVKPISKSEFNRKQHFLIVVNGLDQKTIEAITYWKSIGIDIDAIVYWVYEIGKEHKEHYIEFDMYSPVEGFLSYESNAYIVNTNITKDRDCDSEMLNGHKAAVYCSKKFKVCRLQKGDTVFLYRSGNSYSSPRGIVAYGTVKDGKINKVSYEGADEEEYNVELEPFYVLNPPLDSSAMIEAAGKEFSWKNPLYGISEEDKNAILKAIQEGNYTVTKK